MLGGIKGTTSDLMKPEPPPHHSCHRHAMGKTNPGDPQGLSKR